MRRFSERTLLWFCGAALAALVLIAFATFRAASDYATSVYWLSHTEQVETEIDQIRATLLTAQNGRFSYVFSDQPSGLADYRAATAALPPLLVRLRVLVSDNPAQQVVLASLTPTIEKELNVLRMSTEMKLQGGSRDLQDELSTSVHDLSATTMAGLDSFRSSEHRLLALRRVTSESTYRTEKIVLSCSFVVVLLLTGLSFYELMMQLHERRNAEEVVRRLSGRILQIQDEERRKLARDLHDGLAQIFAALKLSLSQLETSLNNPARASQYIAQSLELVDDGLNQSRTLSYLLHPPMLDEVGFAAAARWLVQGFSERSKIRVALEIPDTLQLPREVELTLFRVLQESLTNVHRHSGSADATVILACSGNTVFMTVTDHGKGVPPHTLENFRTGQAPSGVGLAGMRGRVAEMNGTLELDSSSAGTEVRVTLPIPPASTAVSPLDDAAGFDPPPVKALPRPGIHPAN